MQPKLNRKLEPCSCNSSWQQHNLPIPCVLRASIWCFRSLLARIPPCMLGCKVLTRPSSCEKKPQHSCYKLVHVWANFKESSDHSASKSTLRANPGTMVKVVTWGILGHGFEYQIYNISILLRVPTFIRLPKQGD